MGVAALLLAIVVILAALPLFAPRGAFAVAVLVVVLAALCTVQRLYKLR